MAERKSVERRGRDARHTRTSSRVPNSWRRVSKGSTTSPRKAAPDARRMHLQSANDVLHQHENGVGCKERLGNDKTAIGAVVERALEVLHTVRLIGVRLEAENEAGEGIDPLAAHRIAFVRHRGRANLFLLERLLDLTDGLEDAKITGKFCRTRRHAGNGREHLSVELS